MESKPNITKIREIDLNVIIVIGNKKTPETFQYSVERKLNI